MIHLLHPHIFDSPYQTFLHLTRSTAIGDPSPTSEAVHTKFRWISGLADAKFGK